MLSENTTTIEEFIKSNKTIPLSYETFSFIETMENGTKVSVFDVVNDYIKELRNASIPIRLTDAEYRKYRFKPKLLCHDIYGNPELYFVILLINDMADVKEFDKKEFKMVQKNHLSMLLSEIYNAERRAISDYNTQYSGRREE